MTITATKTPVEAKWSISQMQEETARVVATSHIAAFQTISKFGPEAVAEFQNTARQFKVQHLKSIGVKTAIELVKALAESDANIFGSKVEVTGDEKSASIIYNACGMWNAMQKVGNFTPEQAEQMGANFQNCMAKLAGEFGLKADVQFEGQTCTVCVSK